MLKIFKYIIPYVDISLDQLCGLPQFKRIIQNIKPNEGIYSYVWEYYFEDHQVYDHLVSKVIVDNFNSNKVIARMKDKYPNLRELIIRDNRCSEFSTYDRNEFAFPNLKKIYISVSSSQNNIFAIRPNTAPNLEYIYFKAYEVMLDIHEETLKKLKELVTPTFFFIT